MGCVPVPGAGGEQPHSGHTPGCWLCDRPKQLSGGGLLVNHKEILFSVEQSMLLELFSKGLPRLRCDLLRRISLNPSDLEPCGGWWRVSGKCHQVLEVRGVE